MPTYSGIQDVPLVAGHPALDLVNTVEPRPPRSLDRPYTGPVLDHLAAPADLLVWAARAGLLTADEAADEERAWRRAPKDGAGALERVRATREALYAVLSHERSGAEVGPGPVAPALAHLHAEWAAAAVSSELRAVPGAGRAMELHVGTRAGMRVPDRVAGAVVDLLTAALAGPPGPTLRSCPWDEGGCGWLFLDRSRGGSRRWCVMADCGAKAKARRLNDRRRAARALTRRS